MKKPFEAITAIILGFSFFLLPLYAINFVPQGAIAFFFLGMGEFILFIAGILLLIDHIKNKDNFQPYSYRKKYFLLVLSFILYLVGTIGWASIFHYDDLLNVTYTSFFPLLYATYYYFQQVMVPLNNNTGSFDVDVVPQKLEVSDVSLVNYEKMFFIPVILSFIGLVATIVLPWAIITVKSQNKLYEAGVNNPFFYNAYSLTILNSGLSALGIVAIPACSFLGSLFLFIERKNILKYTQRPFFQIGVLLSLGAAIFAVLSYFALYYTFGNNEYIVLHTIDVGLIICYATVLLSAMMVLNIYRPFSSFEN